MLKGLIIIIIILLLILNIYFCIYGIIHTIKRMRYLEGKWPYELGIVITIFCIGIIVLDIIIMCTMIGALIV